MKKHIQSKWLLILVAFLLGVLLGVLGAGWYYHSQQACGSVDYYDQSGNTKLYSDTTCE